MPVTGIRTLLLLTSLVLPGLLSAAGTDRALAIAKKLELLQSYLGSQRADRIDADGDATSRLLLERARDRASKAMVAYGGGRMDETESLMSEAFRSFSEAVSGAGTPAPALKRRLAELRDEVATYREAYLQALRQKGPGYAINYDLGNTDAMVADAARLERDGDLNGAVQRLKRAVLEITTAVSAIRGSETVTYALEFRTPADEYRYEQNRNVSYTMLVTQMGSQPHLSDGARKMSGRYVESAEQLKAEAERQAAEGRYEEAITTMEEANRNLGRALQMLGVPIAG